MKVLFNYATRSRPTWFFRGLWNIVETMEDKPFEVLVKYDSDDHVLKNDEMFQYLIKNKDRYRYLTLVEGEVSNKVCAINRDIDKARSKWDLLINFSDDMYFQYNGWYDLMMGEIKSVWPDGKDFFAHFSDGATHEKVCTMSIMDRVYYERDKYIYHPSYASLYCDNEATDVAKIRGRHHYFPHVVFKHMHPANTQISQDALYIRNELYSKIDQANYIERKKTNFGIKIDETINTNMFN